MLSTNQRPVIFDYQAISTFVTDMLHWRRQTEAAFSIRMELTDLPDCSPTLVTQVSKGMRRLTRDRVAAFGQLLKLNAHEARYLDHWVAINRREAHLSAKASSTPAKAALAKAKATVSKPVASIASVLAGDIALQRPQNDLFKYWLNPYVKETSRLRGFSLDPNVIRQLIGGIASLKQVKRSIDFLIREGFWRRTIGGKVVQNQLQTTSTAEIPDKKLRTFHKRTLEIARQGLDIYPIEKRQSESFVLAVNDENLHKIKKILTECIDNIERFEQDHSQDNERLYQVLVNLTPIGGSLHELH